MSSASSIITSTTTSTAPSSASNIGEVQPLRSRCTPAATLSTPKQSEVQQLLITNISDPPSTPPRSRRVLTLPSAPVASLSVGEPYDEETTKEKKIHHREEKQQMHMLAIREEEQAFGAFLTPSTYSSSSSIQVIKKPTATASAPAEIPLTTTRTTTTTVPSFGTRRRALDDLIHNAPRFPEILCSSGPEPEDVLPSLPEASTTTRRSLGRRPVLAMKPTVTTKGGSSRMSGISSNNLNNKRLLPTETTTISSMATAERIMVPGHLLPQKKVAATTSVRMPLPMKMPLKSSLFLPEPTDEGPTTTSRRRRILKKRPAATATTTEPLTPPTTSSRSSLSRMMMGSSPPNYYLDDRLALKG